MISFYFCFSSASEPHPGQYCIVGKVSSGGLTEWRKGSTCTLAHITTDASVLAVLSCNNGLWCTVIGFHASKGNISSVPVCVSVYLSVFRLDSPSSCVSPCKLALAGFACLLACFSSPFAFMLVILQAKGIVWVSQTTTLRYPFQSRCRHECTCEMVWPLFLISLLSVLSFTPTFKIKFIFLSEDGWL